MANPRQVGIRDRERKTGQETDRSGVEQQLYGHVSDDGSDSDCDRPSPSNRMRNNNHLRIRKTS